MQTAIALPEGTRWKWSHQDRNDDIYYVHAEAGSQAATTKQALLLIHGFGASTDHWRKNIADLQQDFDVWAIDLLGFGRSGKPDIAYSGDLWRQQLLAFITDVIGRPTVLAGNSLGGYASLCVAAHSPEWVNGVILLNSAGPFSDPESDTSNASLSAKPLSAMTRLKQGWGTVVRNVLLHPWPSFVLFQYTRRRSIIRKTLKKVYLDSAAVTDQLVEDIYRPSCDPGAAKVFASVFKAKKGEPVDILLQKMSCPLLTIWGEGDPWMNTRERGDRFRSHYPSVTEQYVQAGHCPHDEIPQQVNAIMKKWIDSQQK